MAVYGLFAKKKLQNNGYNIAAPIEKCYMGMS